MAKRRTDARTSGRYSSGDSPIDIDGAFAPTKGKQSVEYDVGDEQIGLTQAFGAVTSDSEPKYGWDDGNKWTNYDWNAFQPDSIDEFADEYDDEPADELADEPAARDDGQVQPTLQDAQAEGVGEEPSGVQPEKAPGAEAGGEPADAAGGPEGAADDVPSDATGSNQSAQAAISGAAAKSAQATRSKSSARGRHAAPTAEDSPRMVKSRRMRRVLTVLIVLLVLGLCALGYFMFRTFTQSQEEASHQAQEQIAAPKDEIESAAADDATEAVGKKADVPDLSKILGMGLDEAVAALERGATVSATQEIEDEDSVVKKNVTVSLTTEPVDSRTGGTPAVYLGLDEHGAIVQAGYSASASALGFGSLSFADAVNNERVIEKTLRKIGVNVDERTVSLPEDKSAYCTYASDGTTVTKERCSFEGSSEVNGVPCTWSAVLSYDYTTQVLTGNLSDTVRVIYAYVTIEE